MDLVIIGDEDTTLGFKLAGVKDSIIFNESTINEDIKKCIDAKIIMLTEKVAGFLKENNLLENINATIIEIPDKSGSSGHAMEEISKLFESAIGVKLKE